MPELKREKLDETALAFRYARIAEEVVRLAESDGDAPAGPIGPVRNVRLVGGASRVMSGHASLRQRIRRRGERFERDEVECAAVEARPDRMSVVTMLVTVLMRLGSM